ncbi:MAG: sigma-70 family RNA polymerase sigma factor, partial [Planctomycetota bacterium]
AGGAARALGTGKVKATVDHANGPVGGPKVERFVQLLATCQRRVFLYALRLVHNATDAEEILQETNLVLWRKFDQYRPGTDFARWACRVAYYEVLKFREKRAKEERVFSNDFIETLATESESAMDLLDARRHALSRCLGKLRQNERQLVLKRYQEQATTRSVAEALGRSVQGTRRALHRIRLTLLACIERTLAAAEHA